MKNKNLYETLYSKIVFEDDHEAFKELFFEFYPSLCVFAGKYKIGRASCRERV